MMRRREFLASSLAVLGAPLLGSHAFAQLPKYTDRPLRLIVPFAPGGGVDVFARLIAEKLRQTHGFTIIVENRAGANGSVGGMAVKNADPDGHALLFSAGTHVMAQHVMKSAPYDPVADFAHIARVGEAPMMLVMAPNMAPNTLAEMIAEARKAPDKWTFATAALGAPGHLATVAFNKLTGLNLTVVQYKGTAPALNDVAGGHVQLMIDPVLALLPMADSKRVKGLVITASKRTKIAPSYPSATEAGLPGLNHSSWYGVWGPKNLSADLIMTLNSTINAAVQQLDKDGMLKKFGIEPVVESPAQFEQFARRYSSENAALLKAANFEPS